MTKARSRAVPGRRKNERGTGRRRGQTPAALRNGPGVSGSEKNPWNRQLQCFLRNARLLGGRVWGRKPPGTPKKVAML